VGEWILIGVLYVVVIAGFRRLGGFGSAGDAMRRWGRASSTVRRDPRSTSS
jgi:hypothetical protein